MKNSFLTKIAKDYNTKIEDVYFVPLERNINGKAYRSSFRNAYYIDIDNEKMHCIYQIMFVLFHEIAHIQLFHLGYKYYCESGLKEAREREADQWAFKELKMDDIVCHKCVTIMSAGCLKCKT